MGSRLKETPIAAAGASSVVPRSPWSVVVGVPLLSDCSVTIDWLLGDL